MRLRRPPLVLWRYIALEVVAILVVAVGVQALMNIGIIAFQMVQQEGLRLAYVLPVLVKMSTLSLYYTVPISLLFAVTLGMGRLVADLEVTALKASGVSHAQILTPAFAVGLLCFLLTQYLNGEVIPEVRYERRNLRKVFLGQLTNLGYGGDRTVELPKSMGQIHCVRYYGNVLEQVTVSLWNLEGLSGSPEEETSRRLTLPVTIRAQWARVETEIDASGVEELVVHLYGNQVTAPDDLVRGEAGDPYFLQQIGVDYHRLPISLTDLGQGIKDKRTSVLKAELREKAASISDMDRAIRVEKDLEERRRLEASLAISRGDVSLIEAEIARRRAFAFSCFTFPWVAAPLTIALNCRNRLVPFFFGNVAAIGVFYPLVTIGLVLCKKGCPPGVSIQTGNIVLAILGSVLLWRLRKT